MAEAEEKVEKQPREITECSICMNAFTDPRILPCIHTFCFQCLKRTEETAQKKQGDSMPCPLCRKEFIVPADGMIGMQKNFFMESLLEFKTKLQLRCATTICDMCNVRNEGQTRQIPKATMRCLECLDNYCDCCVKVHQFQRLNKNHQMVKIGIDTETEMMRVASVLYCSKHTQKPLELYCPKCEKIVCVSCFVESHTFHECKDISTVDEEFRQIIKTKARNISNCRDEMLSMRKINEDRKAEFLKEIIEKENEVHKRNQELKEMIEKNTESLLIELSVIKSNHLKDIDIKMDEIEKCCAILQSFEAYCTELSLRGSASDICSSVDQLIGRADELEKDHEALIGRPSQSVVVFFQTSDVLQKSNNNVVGQIIKESKSQSENFAVILGISNGTKCTKDAVKINVRRPNIISKLSTTIPGRMKKGTTATANVYCDTLYATGIGNNFNEIWKYDEAFGWMKCASLVQGRRRHSSAFIDEVLYICGGIIKLNGSVLDNVEAYNTVTDQCTTVGKLVHSIQNSGNCSPFKSSLFIFGGSDNDDNDFSHVQVYNTKDNSYSLLSKPMPCPSSLMRAALWEKSVILLGRDSCFIFNFETETWLERKQFKTDVVHFGLALENGRIFVIGGGEERIVETLKKIWNCRDDVRYVTLQNILEDKPIDWKIHGKLPTPSLVHACAKMQFPV